MTKVGDKIKLTNTDYPEYEELKDKELTVVNIAHNRNEHAYYDESIGGELVTCEEIDFCLYDYEFEVVG